MPEEKVFLTIFYRKKRKEKNTFDHVLPCWPVGFFLLVSLSCFQYQAPQLLSLDWFDVSSPGAFALSCIFVVNRQQSSMDRQMTGRLLWLMFGVCSWHWPLLSPWWTPLCVCTQAVLLQLDWKLLRDGDSSVCLCDTVQSRWVWQGHVEVSRHSVCGFSQGLVLFLRDCPWVRSQECTCSSVSPILLSPSGSWSKLEQMAVINLCLGNLSILEMPFSVHQLQILKMVTEGLRINQTLPKACFCFNVSSSLSPWLYAWWSVGKYVHSCSLSGKQLCLIPENCWGCSIQVFSCAVTCPRSTIFSRTFIALMLEAFTPRHWWSEWRGASDKVGNPHDLMLIP